METLDGTLDMIQENMRSVKSQINCKHILYGNIFKKYDSRHENFLKKAFEHHINLMIAAKTNKQPNKRNS